jgi:hypothetical protein
VEESSDEESDESSGPHDHESQNNIFKLNLQRAKTTLIERKRAAGLLGELEIKRRSF